jgi:hypothetical protein
MQPKRRGRVQSENGCRRLRHRSEDDVGREVGEHGGFKAALPIKISEAEREHSGGGPETRFQSRSKRYRQQFRSLQGSRASGNQGRHESSPQTRTGFVSLSWARAFGRDCRDPSGMDSLDSSHRDADLLRRGAGVGPHRVHAIPPWPESRWDDEVSRARTARPRHHRRADRVPSGHDRLVADGRVRQS